MPPPDPNDYQDNGMQRNAGLIPPMFGPPVMASYPGQTAAAVAQYFQTGIPGGSMGGGGFPNAFPQPMPTFTTASPFMPGPSGVMMPMYGAAPSNPFGMGGGRPAMGGGSMYGGGPMGPPPAYAGPQGQAPVLFSPQIPQGFFDTPFQTAQRQQFATEQRMSALGVGAQGIGARMGMDLAAGYAGFRAGGVLGGLAGFAGSELLGLGRGAQNMFMRNFGAPQLNTQAYGAGIQEMSTSFISGGGSAALNGSGFSQTAANQAAGLLTNMSGSRDFRQSTFNRFNTSDVMRIAQGGAEAGLMQGVQSPEQMRDRVRQLAQSLTSFMELAQEPDVRRAIQTMGNMQMQGLNINETMQAVRNGRTFARAAGMSFNAMAEAGGGMGAQTFQSLGLTQGLGFQTGMQNLGLAGMSQNLRTLGPQMMNLVGGAQGLASANTMFSAGMLQMPMMAPGVMTTSGGIDVNAMRGLMTGGADVFGMTGRGANVLGGMSRRMGVEGLGMALAMQPMLQDTMGRMLQAQGPFAQRNFEDQSMMNLMGSMHQRGSAGFITAAQMSGMGSSQALARATEMADPMFYQRQRDQINARFRERAAEARRQDEANRPGFLDEATAAFDFVGGARRGLGRARRGIGDAWDYLMRGPQEYISGGFETSASRRQQRELMREPGFADAYDAFTRRAEARGAPDRGFVGNYMVDRQISESQGNRGLLSVLGGLAPMDPAERERQVRGMQERGRFATGVLGARVLSNADAARAQQEIFGGGQQAGAFATDVMGMLSQTQGQRQGSFAANTMWGASRAVLGQVPGVGLLARPAMQGGISGQRDFNLSDIRESLVQNIMQGRRVDRPTAEAAATRALESGQAQSVLRQELEWRGTERQRDQLRNIAGRGAAVGTATRSYEVEADEMHRSAMSRIAGESLGTDRESNRRRASLERLINEQGAGFGRTPTQRAQSRVLMAQFSRLHRAATSHDGTLSEEQRQAAGNMMHDMERELVNNGQMSEEDIQALRARVRQNATRPLSAEDEQMVQSWTRRGARGNVRAAMTGGVEAEHATMFRQMASGFTALRGRGNAEATIYSTNNLSEIMDRLAQVSNTGDISSIQDESTRRAAQLLRRGNTRAAREAIEQAGRSAGAPRDQERREQQNQSWWSRLINPLGSLMSSITAARHPELAREQANQLAGVDRTEAAAENAGIGGSGDQLLNAARELREAARLLSGAADSGQLDGLTGQQ